MAMIPRYQVILVATFSLLTFFIEKGTCDPVCPNGITNITGTTSGELVFPSSGTYGENETKCWRIEVPKPYIGLGIYFQSFEIEECKNCECDKLTFGNNYITLPTKNKKCGRSTSRYQEYTNMLRNSPEEGEYGENIWIRFVSDDTVHYKGFNLTYIVGSDAPRGVVSYLNASEDETIPFGTPKVGLKKYPASFEWQWLLIVPQGRQVQITFDIFELEQSKDCENDFLELREPSRIDRIDSGVDQFGPILSKPVCGTNKPSTMQSAGNMVWVHFKSDNNETTTYKGFKASFKASFTSGQGRLSISHPITLLFISALLMTTSKETVL